VVAPKRLLFVCSRNRLRSPTAEQVFLQQGIETDSGGLEPRCRRGAFRRPGGVGGCDLRDGEAPPGAAAHSGLPGKLLSGKRVICLDIPDNYSFMQPELVTLLERRLGRFSSRLSVPLQLCAALADGG
jgi:predicted protein tyrosine phosphatase